MARKKAKRKTSRKPAHPALSERLTEAYAEAGGARMLMVVALIGAVAIGLTFGVSRLEAQASSHISAPPGDTTFAWPVVRRVPGEEGAIEWPPKDMQRRLLEMARVRVEQFPDPLSQDALRAIGADLRASGLFERIASVRRRADHVIEVKGQWRLPAASVRHDGRDHLIGPGAELMPVHFPAGQRSFRVVLGAAFNPPSHESGMLAYGTPWPGEDVQAALRVLDRLRGKPYWHQVRAIDVTGHARRRTVEIVTDRGTRVVWGAAPGEFKPGEVDTETKLGHLRALYERYARIDAGQNRVTIFYEYTDVDRSASSGQ